MNEMDKARDAAWDAAHGSYDSNRDYFDVGFAAGLAAATAKIEALEAKLAAAERLLAESTVIEGKGWSISNNGNPAKLITLRQYDGEGELLSYTHHNSILEAFEALEPKENTDVK